MTPIKVFEVRNPQDNHLRFETLSQHEAELFARQVYSDDKVICNIDEVERKPVCHWSK